MHIPAGSDRQSDLTILLDNHAEQQHWHLQSTVLQQHASVTQWKANLPGSTCSRKGPSLTKAFMPQDMPLKTAYSATHSLCSVAEASCTDVVSVYNTGQRLSLQQLLQFLRPQSSLSSLGAAQLTPLPYSLTSTPSTLYSSKSKQLLLHPHTPHQMFPACHSHPQLPPQLS